MPGRLSFVVTTHVLVALVSGCGSRALFPPRDAGGGIDSSELEHPLPVESGPAHVQAAPITVRQGGEGTLVFRGGAVGAVRVAAAISQVSIEPIANADSSFRVSVPHGASLGPVDVAVTLADSVQAFPGLIVVSPIEVGPDGSDDGAGNAAEPFATLAAAVRASGPADTIRLENNPASYEVSGSLMLPAGVLLEGESVAGVSVEAAAVDSSLIPLGDATLRSLTVMEFTKGCVLCAQSRSVLTFDRVVARNMAPLVMPSTAAGSSLVIEGAGTNLSFVGAAIDIKADDVSVTIRDGSRLAAAGQALRLSGARTKVTIENSSVTSMSTPYSAIFVEGPPSVSLSLVDATLTGGVYVTSQGGSITVQDSSIASSVSYALYFGGTQLSLSGAHIEGLGGIKQGYTGWAASAVVRNTSFKYMEVGYSVEQGVVDLGTADVPGNNTFSSASDAYAVVANGVGGSDVAVSISNSTVDGSAFPVMTTSAPVDLAPAIKAGQNVTIRSF